ncbi:sugar transferase [Planctomonas sp. JC2975]|uniref:sugar transferase n=1 Tax=Planctomonas sp. JC2975 TaxID=2729626 RepID=UPI0014765EBE|nr:sugar transferase [Planctomonas sp. JC2975]NNC11898.1 sugar transferase [Planctomonas sp. JC2975]
MTEFRDPRTAAIGPSSFGALSARARAGAASDEQRWSRRYRVRLVTSDTVIVVATVGVAYVARFGFTHDDLGGIGKFYWVIALAVVGAWSLLLALFHTRDPRIIGVGAAEYRRVANASVITFGALAILFLVAKVDIARGFFVLTLPIGLVGLTFSRWLWRQWLNRQRAVGRYLSRAIVGGSPADVAYVIDQIRRNSGAAYHIVGVATDEPVAGDALDVSVVANLDNIATAAANLQVDTVILASQPSDGGDFVRDLSWRLEGTATDLVLAARLTDVAGPRIHFRQIDGLPLIHVEIPQFEGAKHAMKRALDVALSGLGLLLLSPVLIVLAVLVRLDSPGDAIFRQERVGRNNRRFTMYKFRSMVRSAEQDQQALTSGNEGAGLLFKLKNDPRVTRLGRVLRKYSLDELPQLWNVFVGDMSLVGPRPPLPCEVDAYEGAVHRRLFIKPGLTGMWQIGGRSDLTWDESVRLDLYYVENWSLTGDLIILWRTAKVLVHPAGAY